MLMSAILNIENLEFSYPKTDGNDGYTISLPKLDLNPSDVIAITGVSGCGKSTILECLAFLRKATKVKQFSIQDYDENYNEATLYTFGFTIKFVYFANFRA